MTGVAFDEVLRSRLDVVRAGVLGAEPEGATSDDGAHAEVTGLLVDAVAGWAMRLVPGRADTPPDPEPLHGAGGRYAGADVPLAQARFELQRTIIEISRCWWAAVEPSDVTVMLLVGQALDRDVGQMRAVLTDGYCQALAASSTGSMSRRQLADCLLAGEVPARRLALAAGVEVAARYVVLCTPVPLPGSGPLDDVALGPAGSLLRRSGDVLFALVPYSGTDPAPAAFRALAGAVCAAVAGVAGGAVAELPAAAREARAVLDIALACGRSGPVTAGEVLVERALTGERAALGELAGIVTSLQAKPYLRESLQVLYDHDLDRSATADALHIARRTLTKRLDRIHAITGVHPTSARGVQTFLSALAAHRLVGDSPADAGRGAG